MQLSEHGISMQDVECRHSISLYIAYLFKQCRLVYNAKSLSDFSFDSNSQHFNMHLVFISVSSHHIDTACPVILNKFQINYSCCRLIIVLRIETKMMCRLTTFVGIAQWKLYALPILYQHLLFTLQQNIPKDIIDKQFGWVKSVYFI